MQILSESHPFYVSKYAISSHTKNNLACFSGVKPPKWGIFDIRPSRREGGGWIILKGRNDVHQKKNDQIYQVSSQQFFLGS